jgi:hypothetical protein
MSWVRHQKRYQALAESVEPVSVVEAKAAWYWSALFWVGVVFTLGLLLLGISFKKFMEDYATTLITRQGYPSIWAVLSERVIFHEGRHSTQSTWFGWLFFPIAWISRRLRAWLGLPGFAAVYFLLPLPVGLAAGRFYLELDADRRAWRECLKRGLKTPGQIRGHAERRAERLSGGNYFWAWPAPWARSAYSKAAEAEIRRSAKTANGTLG